MHAVLSTYVHYAIYVPTGTVQKSFSLRILSANVTKSAGNCEDNLYALNIIYVS